MWMDETKSSFEMAKAKIDGRDISYPYLLDAKGEPRLQCTNAFMIWFCERYDIVVKKAVVEKAVCAGCQVQYTSQVFPQEDFFPEDDEQDPFKRWQKKPPKATAVDSPPIRQYMTIRTK